MAELAFAALDMAIYPERQTFQRPRFRGDVAVVVAGNLAELTAEAIENPRPSDNLSGTLVLELWSLDAPYQSGHWSGFPVTSVVLGTLGGQCEWTDCRYAAAAAVPAASAGGVLARTSAPGAKKAAAVPAKVSLNQASEAELVAIKGIGLGLARAIIAARPYATLDDVCRAKGMGRKLLAKVEKQLTL